MISEKRKAQLRAKRNLTAILYKARSVAEGFKEDLQFYNDPKNLTVEEIQEVINHYI